MRLVVLGSLRVCVHGEMSGIRSVRRRNLLAALTAQVGHPVPTSRLAEALWGGRPPASAQAALQVHLSDLRSTLEPERAPRTEGRYIETVPDGYRLSLRTGQLDWTRFEHLARAGRRFRSEGRHTDAEVVLREALRAWTGDAYADCSDVAPDHARWLEDLRLDVEDDLFAAALAAGAPERIVGDLVAEAELHPFRERRVALLMLTLYRVGRQREALTVYDRTRVQLLEQLGCDPGPELTRLHLAVLDHDPSLDQLTLSPPPSSPDAGPTGVGDTEVTLRGPSAAVAVAEAVLSEVGVVVERNEAGPVIAGEAERLADAAEDESDIDGSPFSAVELTWSDGSSARRAAPVAAAATERPRARVPLIGRAEELAQLRRLVAEPSLVSVIGPPGVGKSALVRSALSEREERLVSVDAAAVSTITDLEEGLRDRLGLRDRPLHDPRVDVLRALAGSLLVIDGCDALREEIARFVSDLLEAVDDVTVVTTGRRRLGSPHEQTIELAPLAVPDPGDPPSDVEATPAVRLLVERAGLEPSRLGALDDLAVLVGRLDGLPLALELAAPALRSLGAAELTRRLDASSELLTAGPRSLADIVELSYDWLGERSARLLDRSSVFAGPFTLDDLEEVCADDRLPVSEIAVALSELAESSLVQMSAEPDGLTYRVLSTVRQVARRRLDETGGAEELHGRHATHVASTLGRAGLAIGGSGGLQARRRVERSLADLRAAFDWFQTAGSADEQLALAGRLVFFWFSTGRISEGRRRCAEALARGGSNDARVGCLTAAAFLAWWQGDYDAVAAYLDDALANPGAEEPSSLQGVAHASLAWTTGDLEGAEHHIALALEAARSSGRDWEIAVSAAMAGNVAWYRGEHALAVDRYRQAAEVGRWLRNAMVTGLARRGEALNLALGGRLVEAERGAVEALEASADLGDPLNEGQARIFAALVALEADDDTRAAALLVDGVARSAEALDVMGLLLAGAGLLEVAARSRDHARVAVFDGWLDGVTALTRLPLPPREVARREAAVATARAALGEEELTSGQAQGRTMTPDRLVAFVRSP